MKRLLFFQSSVKGHFLEYLHHEYLRALHQADNYYVFVVPADFSERRTMLDWPEAQNVEFMYLTSDEEEKCNNHVNLRQAWWISIIIRKYVKRTLADMVFLNALMNAMPFLPFLLPCKCRVMGIVYGIFLWNLNNMNIPHKIRNYSIYWMFARLSSFHTIFLLNDKLSVSRLNNYFGVDKFKYLPDPIPNIDKEKLKDIRLELNISPKDKVYLQLGIQPRKHISDIFKAIDSANSEVLKDKVFIFAGVFSDNYEIDYRKWLLKLRDKVRIIDLSGRVPFSELFNLFYIADYSFALYDNANMSSGVLGYSAFFDTFIIGPNKGLLGRLIKENNLGICIDTFSPQMILSAIKQEPKRSFNDYCKEHSISGFNNCIFKEFEKLQ